MFPNLIKKQLNGRKILENGEYEEYTRLLYLYGEELRSLDDLLWL
jgi:hypothetical protein